MRPTEYDYYRSRFEVATACLNSLAKDEAASFNSSDFVLDLVLALKSLSGLRRVTLTSWHRQDRSSFLSENSLLALDNNVPPPFQVLRDRKDAIATQHHSVATLLWALGLAERQLTSLSFFPTPNTVLGPTGAKHFSFPGFCIVFSQSFSAPEIMVEGMRPLRTLRKIHLDIGDQNIAGLP